MTTQTETEQPQTSPPQLEVAKNEIAQEDANFAGNTVKEKIHEKAETLRTRLSSIADWFDEKFKGLTFSQYCYFFAFFLFLGYLSDEQPGDDFFLTIGLIAGLGLIRELWIVFNKIWEQTLGKALLLVLYAATANFALAISALKINSIAGVEPQIFIFTMGFTTLLMLPFWLLGASFVFLATSIVAINIWLLLSFVLRIFRIKVKIHWEDQSFAVLTMLMRVVLIGIVIVALGKLIEPYAKQMDMLDHFQDASLIEKMEPRLADIRLIDPTPFEGSSKQEIREFMELVRQADLENLSEAEKAAFQVYQLDGIGLSAINELPDEALERVIDRLYRDSNDNQGVVFRTSFNTDMEQPDGHSSQNSAPENDASTTSPATDSSEDIELIIETGAEEQEDFQFLNLMVANFLYLFETYGYTACAKEPHQRGLQLDENMLFIAERDSATELGFRFSVTSCVIAETAR